MEDTIRDLPTLLGLFALDAKVGNQDLRDLIVTLSSLGSSHSTAGQYSDSTSQKPIDLLANPITFNTNDEVCSNIAHTNPGEFTVIADAYMHFLFAAQWERTTGGATETTYFWLQRDSGAGFVNIPRSAADAVATGNGESGVVPIAWGGLVPAGDKFRIMQKVSTTGNGLGIVAIAAAAPVEAIPSIMMTVQSSTV